MRDVQLPAQCEGLFKLGCDFMSTPVISIMVPILALVAVGINAFIQANFLL